MCFYWLILLLNITIWVSLSKYPTILADQPNQTVPPFLSPYKRRRHAGRLPWHPTPLPFLLITAVLPPLPRNPLTSPSLGPTAYNARHPTQGPNGGRGASERS
jgi:hypothetical protein